MHSGHGGSGHDHIVQFYGQDDRLLIENVSAYLAEGLKRGDGGLIIGSPEHVSAIVAKTVQLTSKDLVAERVTVLDAAEALSTFMEDGRPSSTRFNRTVGAKVREIERSFGHFRAYGEMVGQLWTKGHASAAIALEQLWNELLESVSVELFCGYHIDVLSPEFQIASIDALLCSHSSVAPATSKSFLAAFELAIHDVLGPKGAGLRLLAQSDQRSSWPALPQTERTILWLRNNLPRHVDEILAKAREYARTAA